MASSGEDEVTWRRASVTSWPRSRSRRRQQHPLSTKDAAFCTGLLLLPLLLPTVPSSSPRPPPPPPLPSLLLLPSSSGCHKVEKYADAERISYFLFLRPIKHESEREEWDTGEQAHLPKPASIRIHTHTHTHTHTERKRERERERERGRGARTHTHTNTHTHQHGLSTSNEPDKWLSLLRHHHCHRWPTEYINKN